MMWERGGNVPAVVATCGVTTPGKTKQIVQKMHSSNFPEVVTTQASTGPAGRGRPAAAGRARRAPEASAAKRLSLDAANFTGLVLGCIETKFCK